MKTRRQTSLWLGVAVALGCMCVAVSASAAGRGQVVETPAWVKCFLDAQANLASVEHSLQPADGASATAGQTVRFSGRSGAALHFAMASSREAIANPDIAAGDGSEEAATEPGELPVYSLSSSAVAAQPRTVYWSASFSDQGFGDCAGMAPQTYSTAVRRLTIDAPQQPPAVDETADCVVPDLHGLRLRRARRRLGLGECRLGKVRGKGGQGTTVVRQWPVAGKHLKAGSKVSVALGQGGGNFAQSSKYCANGDVSAPTPGGVNCLGAGEFCSHKPGYAAAYRHAGFRCNRKGRLEER